MRKKTSDKNLARFAVRQAIFRFLIRLKPEHVAFEIRMPTLGMRWHNALMVTLGSPYGSFLTLSPGPILTHLLRLSKLRRRLMKSFAFFSHDRNITHNP